MTVIYLVRHGQIERGAPEYAVDATDPPLSAQGCVEAAQVRAYLQLRPIARVYASPLRRTRETAALIAPIFGLPVQVEPRLRERINFGDIPEQSFAEFVALWERCNRDRDFVPPVGDSSRGAGQRLEAFVTAVHADLPDGEVIAVAHGGIIADFLLNVLPLSELGRISPAFVAKPYAGEVMWHGAITVVEHTEERSYAVKAIALTRHLRLT